MTQRVHLKLSNYFLSAENRKEDNAELSKIKPVFSAFSLALFFFALKPQPMNVIAIILNAPPQPFVQPEWLLTGWQHIPDRTDFPCFFFSHNDEHTPHSSHGAVGILYFVFAINYGSR